MAGNTTKKAKSNIVKRDKFIDRGDEFITIDVASNSDSVKKNEPRAEPENPKQA